MTRNRSRFVWRVVATVVLIGVLVAGGFAIHRVGWSQGYAAAEISDQGEEAPTPPLAPPGWRPVGFGRGGLMLVTLLLGIVLLAFVGKLLRIVVWGAMAGPAMGWHAMGGSWRHPRHRMHGPMPPWCSTWGEQPSERPEGSDDRPSAEA